MKKELLILSMFVCLIVVLFSCNKAAKTEVYKVPKIDTHSVVLLKPINDTFDYYAHSVYYLVDLNKDGVNDINFYIRYDYNQTYNHTNCLVIPLHSGIQLATKDSTFYSSLDSIVCKLTPTDSLTFYKSNMCLEGDPKMHKTLPKKYGVVQKATTKPGIFTDFSDTTLIFDSYSRGTKIPCAGYVYYSWHFGNGIGSDNYVFFEIAGNFYALPVSRINNKIIFYPVLQIS